MAANPSSDLNLQTLEGEFVVWKLNKTVKLLILIIRTLFLLLETIIRLALWLILACLNN